MDIFAMSPSDFDSLTPSTIPAIKRSDLLRWTIAQYKELMGDPQYVPETDYYHRIINGQVHSSFAGSMVRFIKGPTYNCVPETLSKEPWSQLLTTAYQLGEGDIRSTMRKVDDKLYKKFFDVNAYGALHRSIKFPERFVVLSEMADFISSKGL